MALRTAGRKSSTGAYRPSPKKAPLGDETFTAGPVDPSSGGSEMNSKMWVGWVALVGGLTGGCSSEHAKSDGGTAKLGTTSNLIVNGDAEAGPGASSGSVVVASVPGWSTSGNAN